MSSRTILRICTDVRTTKAAQQRTECTLFLHQASLFFVCIPKCLAMVKPTASNCSELLRIAANSIRMILRTFAGLLEMKPLLFPAISLQIDENYAIFLAICFCIIFMLRGLLKPLSVWSHSRLLKPTPSCSSHSAFVQCERTPLNHMHLFNFSFAFFVYVCWSIDAVLPLRRK